MRRSSPATPSSSTAVSSQEDDRGERAADEVETTATLSDDTLGALVAELGERQATELILALSVYCAVARFTNATRAQIEAGDPLSNVSNPATR